MNKFIKVMFVSVLPFVGCSESSLENSVSPIGSVSNEENAPPYFIFGNGGVRLDENNNEKIMNRSSLILGANESFDDLKKKYEERLSSDSSYFWNLERPVDYFCNEALLAMNSDYGVVISSDGDTLLTDKSLYQSCTKVTASSKTLNKTYVVPGGGFVEKATVTMGKYALLAEARFVVYPTEHVQKGLYIGYDNFEYTPIKGETDFSLKKSYYVQSEKKYVWVDAYADILNTITSCVYDCKGEGNNFGCSESQVYHTLGLKVEGEDRAFMMGDPVIFTHAEGAHSSGYNCNVLFSRPLPATFQNPPSWIRPDGGYVPSYREKDRVGVVGNVAATFREENGDEIVLMATVSANLPENVAFQVYRKYIFEPYAN